MSIAKVTVEYHDPSGVFPLFAEQIQSRLPLRNLHWKSPIRPLRSIESLHVELVRSPDGGAGITDSSRPSSVQSQGGTASPAPAPVKERRHQIPGLRQTPYLKVYLLRCDDAESYKATYRKAVREWLKTHTPSSQSSSKKSSQENHDAFEWMILHVVLPNTGAAAEPKYSGSVSRSEPGNSETSYKFLGRSSGTLLEKLRADFNVSGKSALDRVTQIRLTGDGVQKAQLPSSQSSKVELADRAQEENEAWDDVILKFKSLILSSFDLRVSQYEEDIREKDSQRSLPGWNFCTFFVLKEGLARGFESVGLVDDALAGYEELTAELDALIANVDRGGPTDSFLPCTKELKMAFDQATDSEPHQSLNWGQENLPISATRKAFRELILANNVSVFDFKCYVFARKMAVLLRKSRASQETENLMPLGQLCRHGSWIIPNISRLLREDLSKCARGDTSRRTNGVIDNIVASWGYAVAQQILDETQSSYLSQAMPAKSLFSSMMKEKPSAYPSRGSSLGSKHDQPVDDAQALFDSLKARNSPTDRTLVQPKSGIDQLAAERAKLMLLQRQIIQDLSHRLGFSVGWPGVRDASHGRYAGCLSEVSLSDEEKSDFRGESPNGNDTEIISPAGIYNLDVLRAASSEDEIRLVYERLTRQTLELYFASGQGKGFEHMLADLAILRFQSGDFAGAANYFAKVVSVYSQTQWTLVENRMLLMQGECFKMLNRRDDYVRLLLGLLAKAVARKSSPHFKNLAMSSDDFDLESHQIDGQSILDELLTFSTQLPYEVAVKMSTYFTNITVDPHIRHFHNKEGFQIRLKFNHILEDPLRIDQVKLLLSTNSDGFRTNISLTSEGPVRITKGTSTVTLFTHASNFGWFAVRSLILTSNKITFLHNMDTEDVPQPVNQSENYPSRAKILPILCFPRPDSFEATVSEPRIIHIDTPRYLEVMCSSGWNDIETAELKLRSASSGLRLLTAEANLLEGDAQLETKSAPGIINISRFRPHSSIKISIPYDLEDSHRSIVVRLDVTSSTPELAFSTIQTIPIELPLDVNVHDLFKSHQIFSRFHIRSSNGVPLNLLDVELEGTSAFSVEPPPCVLTPIMVLAKQAATFMYKVRQVRRKGDAKSNRQASAKEKPLILSVDYQCVDEEVASKIFASFKGYLDESDFVPLGRLLTKILKERLHAVLLPSDHIEAVMTNQINIPSFDELGWSTILSGLPNAVSHNLESWLKKWHNNNQSLELSATGAETLYHQTKHLPPRRILITVPLPRLQILQVATLTPSLGPSSIATVGLPITATLCLRHTRRWDSPASPAALKTTVSPPSPAPALEFMYEIDAPPNTWLIGGQRRARFTAAEDEAKSWVVVLIPLRTGRLLLPSVDVRVLGSSSGGTGSGDEDDVTCETDYAGLATAVLVVGNVGRTTVAMKEGLTGPEVELVGADEV